MSHKIIKFRVLSILSLTPLLLIGCSFSNGNQSSLVGETYNVEYAQQMRIKKLKELRSVANEKKNNLEVQLANIDRDIEFYEESIKRTVSFIASRKKLFDIVKNQETTRGSGSTLAKENSTKNKKIYSWKKDEKYPYVERVLAPKNEFELKKIARNSLKNALEKGPGYQFQRVNYTPNKPIRKPIIQWNVVFYLTSKQKMNEMYRYLSNHNIKDKFKLVRRNQEIYAVFVGSYKKIGEARERRDDIENITGLVPKIIRRQPS